MEELSDTMNQENDDLCDALNGLSLYPSSQASPVRVRLVLRFAEEENGGDDTIRVGLEVLTGARAVARRIHDLAAGDPRIVLLKQESVVLWLFGETYFLQQGPLGKGKAAAQEQKRKEDEWGRQMVKLRRPHLRLEKQWTNTFGEDICEEMAILFGKRPLRLPAQNHLQPDLDVGDAIWEAKAQTYYTTGTAGEKVLGVPFKYADIPAFYKKPLRIVCLGGIEKLGRDWYGIFAGPKCTSQRQKYLDFYKEQGIEYRAATSILMDILLRQG